MLYYAVGKGLAVNSAENMSHFLAFVDVPICLGQNKKNVPMREYKINAKQKRVRYL